MLSDQPTQKEPARPLSAVLLTSMGILSLVWGPLSTAFAPHLRSLKYLWVLGFAAVLVLRPEFQRAVWGRKEERSLAGFAPVSAEGWRKRALAFLLYVVFAIVFTLPGSLHPAQTLLGRGGDNYLHAWFLWEFARAIVHGQNPFHTTLILYPVGANLAWATTDILGQMIAIPFVLLLGPILAYNFSLILQLALGAFFARVLFLRISGNAAAATIGGMIFGFSPFLLAHAWGHLSLVTTFPLSLYVLALSQLVDKEEPSWKDGAFLGLALVLVALANYQYALIFVLFTLLILTIDLGREGLAIVKRLWRPLFAGALVFSVCLAPVVLMMLKDRHVTKPAAVQEATSFSADLLSFFVPSLQQSLFGQYVRKLPEQFFVGPGGIEGIEYIGLAAGIFAVMGCWVARGNQRRWVGRAMVAGVVFAILSLGPLVHILGRASSLVAPAAPLYYKLSVLRFLREPARFSVITMLCTSLLASIGLAFLLSKVQVRSKRSVLLCAIGAVVFLEYLAYPFPSSSIIQPARYFVPPKTTQACTVPSSVRDGSVLTIPIDDWWHHNDAMWMQMRDGGRYSLIDGRVSPYVPGSAWEDFIDKTPILNFLHAETLQSRPTDRIPSVPVLASAYPGEGAGEIVKQLDLRAVVIFDAPERPTDVEYVRRVFGGSEKMVGTCAIFELPRVTQALDRAQPAQPSE